MDYFVLVDIIRIISREHSRHLELVTQILSLLQYLIDTDSDISLFEREIGEANVFLWFLQLVLAQQKLNVYYKIVRQMTTNIYVCVCVLLQISN